MRDLDFRQFENEFIIHYGVDDNKINAKTFGESLVSLTNSIKHANSIINAGFEIEIIVESTDIGSFKVNTKTIYNSVSSIFSKDNIKNIALGIIASIIYDLSKPSDKINIIVNTNEYILEKGEERIILPKEAQHYYESIKNNEEIKKNLKDTFITLQNDKQIESIYFDYSASNKSKEYYIDKTAFQEIIANINTEPIEDKQEKVINNVNIIIIRAILEQSNRKWQFIWNGIRISAPVSDSAFYNDFNSRKITIAPNDALNVDLKIILKKDEALDLYINSEYEVIKVHKHIESAKQMQIDLF